ncbi:hypothetical protein AAW00_13670 [Aurantiacibacter luteus]|uniref:Uncharacterized protein n=2 Tax=Aurantiacibacter luteus TaxID=1581420 RepID=A0A0G9MP18_9SPHN|nr:hypothetical protein AAW00_13670 [Aurantiacibacter luteus]
MGPLDLAKPVLGLARWVWIALALALVLLLAWLIAARLDSTVETIATTAEDRGATRAVVQGQHQTLEQLKDANDAEQDLRTGGERSAARFDQCLQDSRRPAACERYRPNAR